MWSWLVVLTLGWVGQAAYGLDTDPAWLPIATCRVTCIEKFLVPPYSDSKCNSSMSCKACWILCKMLLQNPYCEGEAIKPCCLNLCSSLFHDEIYNDESRHKCIAGCQQACMTVNIHKIPQTPEELSESSVTFREAPRILPLPDNRINITWQSPELHHGLVTTQSSIPLIYILLQEQHFIMRISPWWSGVPRRDGFVILLTVGKEGVLKETSLYIPTAEPPAAYGRTVSAVLRSQMPAHVLPGPEGNKSRPPPYYSYLKDGDMYQENIDYDDGSSTYDESYLDTEPARSESLSGPDVKVISTNGRLHAQVTWQSHSSTVDLHWARVNCHVDKEFPSCNEPSQLYTNTVLNSKNGSQETIGLTYNSLYWVEVSGSNKTYFTTPGCHNPDQFFKRCLSTELQPSSRSGWYLNVTCINYDIGKDLVAVLLQWPRPRIPGSQNLTYNIKYWVVIMEPNKYIKGNSTLTDKTFQRMELQPDSRFVFMVSTEVEGDIDGMTLTIESDRLVVNTSLKDLPPATNVSQSALTCDYIHTERVGSLSQLYSPSLESSLAISLYCLVGAFTSLALLCLAYKKCRSFRQIIITKAAIAKSNSYKSTPGSSADTMQQQLMSLQDEWELDSCQLKMGTELGQGAFGRVLTGQYQDKKVAIKMLKENVPLSYREDLLCEIGLMKQLGHHNNIVSLVGACTLSEPIALVMEYVPYGNLQAFLKQCRLEGELQKNHGGNELVYTMLSDTTSTEVWTISPNDILSFTRQIALAMEYLAHKQYVHRDLAARNILVAEDKVVKVCDFGLSRVMYNGEEYHKLTNGKLPLKWMALESLRDRVFTSQSDVWSFGILLWEIVTMGGSPYPSVALADLYGLLSSGYRMDKPNNCSPELFTLMCQCWREDPLERPSFTFLRSHLEDLLSQNCDYLELDNIDVPVQPSDSSSLSMSVFCNQAFHPAQRESPGNILQTVEHRPGASVGPDVRPRPDIIDFTNLNPGPDQKLPTYKSDQILDTCLSIKPGVSNSNEGPAVTNASKDNQQICTTAETQVEISECVVPPDIVTQAPGVAKNHKPTEDIVKSNESKDIHVGYCTLAMERTQCVHPDKMNSG